MKRGYSPYGLLLALSALLPRGADAGEASILPLTAFRNVAVIVTVSNGDDWQSEGGPADSDALGLYDHEWDLEVALQPSAVAQGRGIQSSDIASTGIHADATLETAADALFGGAASVIASNTFQATFSVQGPVQYTLQGSLTAFEEATVSFGLLGEDIDESFTVTNDSIPLTLSGVLPTGMYVLFAQIEGGVNVNLPVEEVRQASGRFAFTFDVSNATPVERCSWGEVKRAYRGAATSSTRSSTASRPAK